MLALTPSERRVPPLPRTLLLVHRSYGLMRQSRVALPYFGFWPRSRSLRRLLPAPAATGILPTLSLQICHRMPGPLPRRSHRVHLPVSSSVSSAFPRHSLGRLPVGIRERDFSRGLVLEVADISLCSGLRFCSPPRSLLPLRIFPQGSRGFYIRAYRASLPLHAPDMLSIRIQAIDRKRTSTFLDLQPFGRSECLTNRTVAGFHSPPRRTERADFPHSALLLATQEDLWDVANWQCFQS